MALSLSHHHLHIAFLGLFERQFVGLLFFFPTLFHLFLQSLPLSLLLLALSLSFSERHHLIGFLIPILRIFTLNILFILCSLRRIIESLELEHPSISLRLRHHFIAIVPHLIGLLIP